MQDFNMKPAEFNMQTAQFDMQTGRTAHQTPLKELHRHSPQYWLKKKPMAKGHFWLKNTQKPC
jgi:hypothetical protein